MPDWLISLLSNLLLGVAIGISVGLFIIWANQMVRLPAALLLTAIVAVTLFAYWPQVVSYWSAQTQPKEQAAAAALGQFGDMFGALTSLLSALTFLALLATIWYERQTSAEQRAANAKQSFESTYFQLMKAVQDVRPIELVESGVEVGGAYLVTALAREICIDFQALKECSEADRADRLWGYYYRRRYDDNENLLGRYYRCLYHWFKFVRESGPKADEMRYANLARAQLSNSELILLAVNCLAYEGSGLKQFVLQYALLKHLRDSDTGTKIRQVMEEFYPADAFEKPLPK